jgi:maltose/moltooligosaccharide transporter
VTSGERMPVRTMVALTLPTLAFSAASSIVVTFLPLILKTILKDNPNSGVLIAFAVAGEGIFCALIPLWVGVLSDRIWTERWGRRRPFMIFAAPFMAAALMLAPFQPSYVPIAISTFLFFAAYHFYSSPYQSLLPEVTPAGYHGRVQGYQAVMRGGGMFLGVVIAAFLFEGWEPLPFLLSGVFIMVVTYVTVTKIHEPEQLKPEGHAQETVWGAVRRIWRLALQDKAMRRFMVAAFLWESTLGGVKPFIMLYFTETLGGSVFQAGLMMGVVGVVYMFAGLISGYLADRFGRARIMRIGLWLYVVGAAIGAVIGDIKWAFIFMPVFGLGGAVVMTLPYAILIGIMPRAHIGGFTAMFSMVRGLANVIAPMVAGAAIDGAARILEGSQYVNREYAAIWAVCGLMIIASLFFFRADTKDEVVNG